MIISLYYPQDPSIRIYVIASYAVHARPLLCEVALKNILACIYSPSPLHYVSHPQAYQRGLRYPRHLLLTYGWYEHNWWLVEDQNFSCTAQERESVLSMSLSFLQFDFLEDRNLTTDTGIVSLLLPCFLSTLPHTKQDYGCQKQDEDGQAIYMRSKQQFF